jgi:hypothetical protein
LPILRIVTLYRGFVTYPVSFSFLSLLSLSLPSLPEMPKVSYVEHILQWLLFIEKYVLYPLTFLFGFNLSAHHYKARFTDM